MKKRFFLSVIFSLAALGLFSQGRYLTTQIVNAIEDLREVPFGAVAFADSATTIALTASTWSVVSEFVSVDYNDVTVSDDTITIQKTGGYAIDAMVSYNATSGDTISVQLFKNSTAFGPKPVSTAAAGITSVSFSTFLDLTEGDIITLRMYPNASGDDATLRSGSLFIRRIYREHY